MNKGRGCGVAERNMRTGMVGGRGRAAGWRESGHRGPCDESLEWFWMASYGEWVEVVRCSRRTAVGFLWADGAGDNDIEYTAKCSLEGGSRVHEGTRNTLAQRAVSHVNAGRFSSQLSMPRSLRRPPAMKRATMGIGNFSSPNEFAASYALGQGLDEVL